MKRRTVRTRKLIWIALSCAAILAPATPAGAKVTRIVINKAKSEPRAYDGKSFGKAGVYEKIEGTAYGELDPKDRRNAIIQDIQLAPRNSRGMVEYSVTFMLIKPVDMANSSGVLFYEVLNRGRKIDPGGNAQGNSYLMSGWQGEIPPSTGPDDTVSETLQVPTARNPDGSSITGLVLGRAPVGLQASGAYAIGYSAQVSAYLFALTDRYPHSSPLAVLRTS